MGTPTHFKRWEPFWFHCPSCGYGSWKAHVNVRLSSRNKAELRWEFWCAQCERIAVLANPYFVTALTFICAVILFVSSYRALVMLSNHLDIWGIGFCLALGGVLSYVIGLLLGRFFSVYASASTDGL